MNIAERDLRSLVVGPAPGAERIFFHNIRFRGHNNPRYSALLPRFSRVDKFFVTCSDQRIVRGLQFRALMATRSLRYRAVCAAATRRYRYAFVTDNEQIPYLRCPVVADVDDPVFTQREVDLLNRPNVRAYVVTTARAGQRFTELGVRTPFVVVSQGINFSALDADRIAQVRIAHRRPGEIIVGYVAAWLLTAGDRDGENPLYSVDHMVDLWESIRARVPNARLWLIGQPSPRVVRRFERRDDVVLLGRLDATELMAYASNFDIALYPRLVDHAPFAVKLAEYMGLGIPCVAYDLEVTKVMADAGAGLQARTAAEFVNAVELLARDGALRSRLAAAARTAGRAFDFNTIASRYEREVFDRYLPDR